MRIIRIHVLSFLIQIESYYVTCVMLGSGTAFDKIKTAIEGLHEPNRKTSLTLNQFIQKLLVNLLPIQTVQELSSVRYGYVLLYRI